MTQPRRSPSVRPVLGQPSAKSDEEEAMKPFGKLLLVTLGFGVFGFAMSLVPQKTATGAGSAPVTVVNTPLSIEGTVGVNNFPATQTVTGTVAVSNFPAFQSPVAAETFNSFDANGECSFIGTDVGHNDFVSLIPFTPFRQERSPSSNTPPAGASWTRESECGRPA